MPTMPELGAQVLEALDISTEELVPFSNDLEQWMSFLSVDQPWLDPILNHQNRALFMNVSNAVYETISTAQERAMATEPPSWLVRLVWTWCDEQTSIFTFNYDTLVERVVGQIGRLGTWGDLYAAPLSARISPGDGAFSGTYGPTGPVPMVFKLHGSTSWAFGGLDSPPNDRIVLTQDMKPWRVTGIPDNPPAPRHMTRDDDLVPLIIPPTFTKGQYYSNSALRAQWRRGAAALTATQDLTIFGYSFPRGDLVARQWVSTNFGGERMSVVDRDPMRPAEIRSGLAIPRNGDDFTGDGAIRKYVDANCGSLVRWRLWNLGDDVGTRASLFVDGVDLLMDMDPRNPPWGTEIDAAQRWLHERIEKQAPLAIDRAVSVYSEGVIENRMVVLRKTETVGFN